MNLSDEIVWRFLGCAAIAVCLLCALFLERGRSNARERSPQRSITTTKGGKTTGPPGNVQARKGEGADRLTKTDGE